MNYEELKDWCDEARRSVGREMDRLQEQQLTMGNHLQVLEAAGDLLGEMERQKDELEQKQQEIHNHFESGSSSQVFNDKVNGKFTKKQNDKNKSKKRWRKMVRKVL